MDKFNNKKHKKKENRPKEELKKMIISFIDKDNNKQNIIFEEGEYILFKVRFITFKNNLIRNLKEIKLDLNTDNPLSYEKGVRLSSQLKEFRIDPFKLDSNELIIYLTKTNNIVNTQEEKIVHYTKDLKDSLRKIRKIEVSVCKEIKSKERDIRTQYITEMPNIITYNYTHLKRNFKEYNLIKFEKLIENDKVSYIFGKYHSNPNNNK